MSNKTTPKTEETATQATTEEVMATQAKTEDEGKKKFVPITTQEEYDKIFAGVRYNVEKDYKDYEALKVKADKYDEIAEDSKSELEKMRERAEVAEVKASTLQIKAWKSDVAIETGVDPRVLYGSTLEEIQACAKTIKEVYPAQSAGVVRSEGGKPTAATLTKEQILAIEDETERKKRIEENLELFY